MWDGFSYDGKMNVHIVEGLLAGVRYRDEVVLNRIEPHVNEHLEGNMGQFRITTPFARLDSIRKIYSVMVRLAKSPDFFVIENLVYIIGRVFNSCEGRDPCHYIPSASIFSSLRARRKLVLARKFFYELATS